jgi:hypothetical protein
MDVWDDGARAFRVSSYWCTHLQAPCGQCQPALVTSESYHALITTSIPVNKGDSREFANGERNVPREVRNSIDGTSFRGLGIGS